MKKCRKIFKKMVFSGMTAVMVLLTACGGDDSQKVYLEEIKAKDYVTLGEYKGIAVSQPQPEVTDEERDAYINQLLCVNPERAVIEGDTVNIDYSGTLDGVAFDGGTAQGQSLTIGSGQFIEGFEEGLIGADIGDTVELNLTFPEDYHAEEMAGREVVFTVTVNSITASEPQELTDAFVQRQDIGLSTVDEYKQYVYDRLYEEAVEEYEMNVENEIVSVLAENCEFRKEPPQAMVDRYEDVLTQNLTMQAAAYGATLEQLMQLYGMDEEAYTAEIRNQAVMSAKQYIILQAIADAEGITISDEEWNEEMQEMADNAGYETLDQFKDAVDGQGYKEYMLGQRVLDMLLENADISEEQADETLTKEAESAEAPAAE